MAVANDTQVQKYVNDRIRPHCEMIRALIVLLQDDKAAIDEVYAAVVDVDKATWKDDRADGPPKLLGPADVKAYNQFISDLVAFMVKHDSYLGVLSCCVRPLEIQK